MSDKLECLDYLKDCMRQIIYRKTLRSCAGTAIISPVKEAPKIEPTKGVIMSQMPITSQRAYRVLRLMTDANELERVPTQSPAWIASVQDPVWRNWARSAIKYWSALGYSTETRISVCPEHEKAFVGPIAYLKQAYQVQGDCGSEIVFARSAGLARVASSSGAGNSAVKRAPEFDQYAENGTIKQTELILKHGLSVCCSHCQALTGTGSLIKAMTDTVFCSSDCFLAYHNDPPAYLETAMSRVAMEISAHYPKFTPEHRYVAALAVSGHSPGGKPVFIYQDGSRLRLHGQGVDEIRSSDVVIRRPSDLWNTPS